MEKTPEIEDAAPDAPAEAPAREARVVPKKYEMRKIELPEVRFKIYRIVPTQAESKALERALRAYLDEHGTLVGVWSQLLAKPPLPDPGAASAATVAATPEGA